MEEELIKTWSNGKFIFIEIPIDLLKFSQENHPEHPYKILDTSKMGKWISKNIIEFNFKEDGSTDFYNLLDDMFEYAMEYGENWIEYIELK